MSPEERVCQEAVESARRATDEGLSDVALERVLRRVSEGIQARDLRPLRTWRWPALAGLAASAALAVWWGVRDENGDRGNAAPPLAAWEVVLQSGGSASHQAVPPEAALGVRGTVLAEGEVLYLQQGGADRAVVLGPARVRLAGSGRLHIDEGLAAFEVAPKPPLHPFVVEAGAGAVTVKGTRFVLQVQKAQLQGVRVDEGAVLVARDLAEQGATLVRRGEQWGTPVESAWAPAQLAALFAAQWWTMSKETGWALVTAESPAEVELDGEKVGRTPVRARLSVGRHALKLEAPSREAWSGTVDVSATETVELRPALGPLAAPEPAVASQTTAALQPEESPKVVPKRASSAAKRRPEGKWTASESRWASAADDVEQRQCAEVDRTVAALLGTSLSEADQAAARALSAECLLRSGRREAARAAYLTIAEAFPRTPSGEVARFEVAKLMARLSSPGAALPAVEEYLARYPSGRFAMEAQFARCEALVDVGRRGEAVPCLEAIRRGGTARAADALLLLASVARLEQQWAQAAALYQEYVERHAASRNSEEAAYQRIVVVQQGGLPGLHNAINDYLARFPSSARAETVKALRR